MASSGLWDVVYARGDAWDGTVVVMEVEADTISAARAVALPLVGTRSTIVRIDPAVRPAPPVDNSKRKVQGT